MSKKENQRQKKLAKQRSKKAKQNRELARKKNQLVSLTGRTQAASRYPVAVSCFGKTAYELNGMVPVYFGRTLSNGQIMLTVWLLDNACLGVKDAFVRQVTESELDEMLDRSSVDFVDAKPETVLALIEGSLAFASGIGFSPISIVPKLLPIFGDVDSSLCEESFAYGGEDGKPCYISGPFDTREKIGMIQSVLQQNLGSGNYDYVVAVSEADLPDFALEQEYDDEDENMQEADVVDGYVLPRRRSAG